MKLDELVPGRQFFQENFIGQFVPFLVVAGLAGQNHVPKFVVLDVCPGNEVIHLHTVLSEGFAAVKAFLGFELIEKDLSVNRKIVALRAFIQLTEKVDCGLFAVDFFQVFCPLVVIEFFQGTLPLANVAVDLRVDAYPFLLPVEGVEYLAGITVEGSDHVIFTFDFDLVLQVYLLLIGGGRGQGALGNTVLRRRSSCRSG